MKISSFGGSAAATRRESIKTEHWPDTMPWLGPAEVGYFCGPRTLPFVLAALSEKSVSHGKDLGAVYVDLLANHMSGGVVELGHADDHAYACGYAQVRTWRDRMHALEEAGFIKTIVTGNKKFAKVLLIHPSTAMHQLRKAGKIGDELWNAYRDRQTQFKEAKSEEVEVRPKKKP